MPDELLGILTGKPSAAPKFDALAFAREEAARQKVDPELVVRVMGQESGAKGQKALSRKGAIGRMQLMPETAKDLGVDPNDERQNIVGGVTYLKQQLDEFKDPKLALAAYNAGPQAVRDAGGIPNIKETQDYVAAITGEPVGDLSGILGVTPAGEAPEGPSPEREARIKELTDPNAKPASSPVATNVAITNGKAYFRDTGKPLNPAQADTLQTLYKGGQYDPEKGLINGRPIVGIGDDGAYPNEPGTFYIDQDGVLGMVPMTERRGLLGRGGGGLARGGFDVMQSIGKVLPGTSDSDAMQTLRGNRLIYDAQNKGDLVAGAGRFLGQAIPTTAALVAGGEVLAPIRAAAGPVGEFLAGNAGRGGNLFLRGASLGTSGAIEGAGAGALTSGANDESLGENMMTGAVAGSVLKPVASGAFGAGRRLLAGKAAGAIPAAEQQAILDKAANLPVEVPLTQGIVSGAPGQQMAENLMLKGAKGDQAARIMQEGAAARQGALRGNVEAIENRITGQPSLTTGQGGAAVSEALNTAKAAKGASVDAAYQAARDSAEGGFLPASERPVVAQRLREAVKDYDPDEIGAVTKVLDSFDGSPTSSTLTPTDLFEARAKLTKLRGMNDPYKGGAAAQAVKALDGYIDDALKADLIQGDPKTVQLWKKAIGERRAFGKLFEGNDLIQDLTEEGVHGEGRALKVAPEDASNLIFGRSGLGSVGRKNLSRDLIRLKGVLGPDSEAWNALRGEAFKRLAREGEGAPEAGQPQFSGQKFFKAWNKLQADNPQVVDTLFSPDERKLISDFAEVAQKATTSVKGGDNPSNSGVLVVKKVLDNLWTAVGGAVGSMAGPGGAVAGATIGKGLDSVFKDMGAVVQAQKALRPKVVKPPAEASPNRLLGVLPPVIGSIESNKLLAAPQPAQ